MKIDLKTICAIQTESGQEWRTFAHCVRVAKSLNAKVRQDKHGNLYIIKGKAKNYPCVVAHLDSVHKINDRLEVLEYNGMLTGFNPSTMKQSGIGGDDKVGIYIALKCLEQFDNIKLAFFVSEEVGCVGSRSADMSFFNDCRYVLQADRRGKGDFITTASGTELSGAEFQKAVQPYLTLYGFKKESGMMTDVMQLKENGLKVACANVSCGYYRPHSADEYIVIADVENTLNLFHSIIKNLKQVYSHEYTPKVYTGSYYGSNYGYYGNYGSRYYKGWNSKKETNERNLWSEKQTEKSPNLCESCFESATSLTYYSDFGAWICKDCEAWMNK